MTVVGRIDGLRVPRESAEAALVPASLAVLAAVVAGTGLLVVVVAGFALSFDAVRTVGRACHVRQDWAWLLPAAVDGAMAVATVTVVVLRHLGRPTVYPWAVVLVNAGISIGCNALHAAMGASLILPEQIAMVVSAIPALNLALSVHLLVALVDAAVSTVSRSASSRGQPISVAAGAEPFSFAAASDAAQTSGAPEPGCSDAAQSGVSEALMSCADEGHVVASRAGSARSERRTPSVGRGGGVAAGGVGMGVGQPVAGWFPTLGRRDRRGLLPP